VELPYLTYASYLRERHGCAVHRVAVDAGFCCPNRGGRSGRGCSYCAEDGSRAPYLPADASAGASACGECIGDPERLRAQVSTGIEFLRRRYRAEAFILFFQAYSNTNAPVGELRRIYDTGLALAPFKGLNVATRPDCLDPEKAALLASYRDRGLEVWVELGVQSLHDDTLARIGRGHTAEDFIRAFRLLKQHGLLVAAHLIFGLPGERAADIMTTVETLARLPIDGVKIHNLHIPAGTLLAQELAKGEVTAPAAARHLEYVIAAIERLPPSAVIMRLTCDTPKRKLAAPRHFWPKAVFAERLAREMAARSARQGRLCAGA
jgi:radical SAM protein (TIGR01212 family)